MVFQLIDSQSSPKQVISLTGNERAHLDKMAFEVSERQTSEKWRCGILESGGLGSECVHVNFLPIGRDLVRCHWQGG